MAVFNTIFYTALTIGILIFIHELGHFLAAKLTGMRVDRFSIGFPPRAFGKKIGDTDYCVSWIPFGGYVKIAGMIDESFDTDFLHHEPQPWEFRAKPMSARMFVISAGVLMNILLAFIIFWTINIVQGKFVKLTNEIGYVIEDSPAEKAGLLPGDKIISVNNRTVRHWDDINNFLYIETLGEDISLTVNRQNQQLNIFIPRENIPAMMDEQFGIIESYTAVTIQAVEPNMPADQIKLRPGDIILAVNNSPIAYSEQMVKSIKANSGKKILLHWKRNDSTMSSEVTVTEAGRIGIQLANVYHGPFEKIKYSPFEAFSVAGNNLINVTYLFFYSIRKVITGEIAFKESFGGPIKIAQFATQSAEYGIISFLGFVALLSMSLAILNILPIPALDGGHLTILLIEKIAKREIPQKIKIGIQQAGFIILIAFMAFVIYNDIISF